MSETSANRPHRAARRRAEREQRKQEQPQGVKVDRRWRDHAWEWLKAIAWALGVALLIAKGPPTAGDEARRVVITASDLAQLRVAFMRTWQREPTDVELRGELESIRKTPI